MHNLIVFFNSFYENNVLTYVNMLKENPIKLITLILDILIVTYLVYFFIKITKGTRAWQLLKGICVFIIATWLTQLLNLNILNYILESFMTYIVIILIVIFQPELRRALEQIGRTKFRNYFELDDDLEKDIKEAIYKTCIAVNEMSKINLGALIVFERDIMLNDIIGTGIAMNSEISPQLLVNIFCTKTPLHDGAVIIKENKIAASACMLPLINNPDTEKKYGTRHRAAMGITFESDSVAIVVSEETGQISVAKDGKLTKIINDDEIKKFLISNLIQKNYKSRVNRHNG